MALAPLSHHGAFGTGPPAGTVAADRVRATAQALYIASTDETGIELGKLAMAVDAASSPQAGVEHRAVGVKLA